MENAGRAGIPQIVAPGAIDMVDLQAWQPLPQQFSGRPFHAHNRLIASITTDPDGRRAIARVIGEKLRVSSAPTAFILPARGIQEWDQEGEPLYEPEALDAFVDEMRKSLPASAIVEEVDEHINSAAFSAKALEIFDRWIEEGVVARGRP
jgi:uncharacterized protein (UPF0261 family)